MAKPATAPVTWANSPSAAKIRHLSLPAEKFDDWYGFPQTINFLQKVDGQHVYNTRPPRRPVPRSEGVRTVRWKYVRYTDFDPSYEQLFDLGGDPLEERNLAEFPEHVDTLATLRRQCDTYRNQLR